MVHRRSHADYGDPQHQESLPFQPFGMTLCEVLRHDYITPVTVWLLGHNETSLLAMEVNSAWETALTVTFLLQSSNMLDGERPDLQSEIDAKVVSAARWLLTKRTAHQDGTFCWEHVTWDTSVIINALVQVLSHHRHHFSSDDQHDIEITVIGGMLWLHRQFAQWEPRVKYPGGPADVAQIANTVLMLQEVYPELYLRFEQELGKEPGYDLPLEVIQYLLHRRTYRKLIVADDSGTIDARGCWWDDYFSTAEVIETLARFHHAAEVRPAPQWKHLLEEVKICLIESCAFLEHTQLDGMWGNHTDTLRILCAYVMTRRLLPQHAEGRMDSIIQPEIHIAFKALRWICDEKQIFDDGSFLHTLFLTVFYASTLAEVHQSWEPARRTVEKLYDDVVWASPVRTTPERTRRLAADISNDRLREALTTAEQTIAEYASGAHVSRRNVRKALISGGAGFVLVVICLFSSSELKIIRIALRVTDAGALLTMIALFVSVIAVTTGLIWKFDEIVRPARRR